MVEGETLTLFGDGTQARDYTYCDDIVAGRARRDRVDRDGAGRRGELQPRRQPVGATEAMVAEIAAALGIKPKIEWAPMQPGDVQRTAADLTKSGAVLGYQPRTPFPEGIRRFVAGTGRPMAGQTERLLARARERFVVQDYYGTVHLLE